MPVNKCPWVLEDYSGCGSPLSYHYKIDDDGKVRRVYHSFCSHHMQLQAQREKVSRQVYKSSLIESKEPVEHYTCFGCNLACSCEFAFHLYNLDGDCLAEK